MLNTDVELFYDLTLDSVDLLATCSPFQDCGLALTYDYASNFAEVSAFCKYSSHRRGVDSFKKNTHSNSV